MMLQGSLNIAVRFRSSQDGPHVLVEKECDHL